MSREVRKVRGDWKHPTNKNGQFIGLREGYDEDIQEWDDMVKKQGRKAAREWMGRKPRPEDYMPAWTPKEADHFMMYETTSEGSPISPAFKTAEELARWLADSGASAFGMMTATYEQWLAMIQRGSSPSAVMVGGRFMSGVEATKP